MGYHVEVEQPLDVLDLGMKVGEVWADLLVDDTFVIETKATDAVRPGHVEQCRAYMRCAELKEGLVLNFGRVYVGIKAVRLTDQEKGEEKSAG